MTDELEPGAGELREWVGRKRARSKAANTQRAYRSHWTAFTTWCDTAGVPPLPATAETVVAYLRAIEGKLAVTSLSVRLAAIHHAHRTAGHESPTRDDRVQQVWVGFQREHGRPPKRVWALSSEDIKRMLAECPDDVGGDRDAAIILVGFAGGLRRSELVALDVEDITWRDRGAVLVLRGSKTDRANRGRTVAIPYLSAASCPARHLKRYIKHGKLSSGPLFQRVLQDGYTIKGGRMDGGTISRIIKKLCEDAGLDSSRYSGHSLRAGFVTTAKRNKADVVEISRSTGHQNLAVLGDYIRTQDPFDECAAYKLGL